MRTCACAGSLGDADNQNARFTVVFRTLRVPADALTNIVSRFVCVECIKVLLPRFDPPKWEQESREYEWVRDVEG